MASDVLFTEDEVAIDEGLGYPKAYAKICRNRSLSPFRHGPPFTFIPFALPEDEVMRADKFDEMFPIINPNGKPTTKPKIFLSLLWKQLNHLGNAGFDPEMFRVDPYGNVLYYHADPASPLAWDIDHWFPCSRGGFTVPSNLRILQWQVCKKKQDQLEFLIPWWEFQVGVSINQFLSIFASSNSDFRHRAFSWLFSDGESEELNPSQTVDSHAFPQHFRESKDKVGLAPAAIVLTRREPDALSTRRSLDSNRRPRSSTPIIAAKKLKSGLKENEDPNMVSNPYQAIVMARDSLRHREESSKMLAEIQKLDDEVDEMKRTTEDEKATIQELELVLIKRKRRVEKCRRLAEEQSSYRMMLEKMIRDAMHQSVVYKEQVRLNQAATNALMARLEAQKAICDSSERDLHIKFKQRDELEKQIRPVWDQARKRSRVDDSLAKETDDKVIQYFPEGEPRSLETKPHNTLIENYDKNVLYLTDGKPETEPHRRINGISSAASDRICLSLPEIRSKAHLHKELRVFLEEEQKVSGDLPMNEEEEQEEFEQGHGGSIVKIARDKPERSHKAIVPSDEKTIKERPQETEIQESQKMFNLRFPVFPKSDEEEDEESIKQQGKGNVEKWLQMLLENSDASVFPEDDDDREKRTAEIIRKLDLVYPSRDTTNLRAQEFQATGVVKQAQKVSNQNLATDRDITIGKEEFLEIKARRSTSSTGLPYGEKKEIVQMRETNAQFKNPPYRVKDEKSKSNEALKNLPHIAKDEMCKANEVYIVGKDAGNTDVCEGKETRQKIRKEKELTRSESARLFRRIPSSPSLILSGMKKRVDCIRKKPLVMGDDDVQKDNEAENSFIRSSIRSIKRAMQI